MAGVRGDLPRIRLLPAPREGPKDPDRDVGPSFVRCSVVAIPSRIRRRFDPDAAGGGKVRLSSRRTPNESIEATGAGDGGLPLGWHVFVGRRPVPARGSRTGRPVGVDKPQPDLIRRAGPTARYSIPLGIRPQYLAAQLGYQRQT